MLHWFASDLQPPRLYRRWTTMQS